MQKSLKIKPQTEQTMGVGEFFVLLGVNLKVTLRNLGQFFRDAIKYYGNVKFLKEDLSLRLMYLFHNPFKISKRFLMKRGESDVYTYGETPLTTLELIAREAGISAKDRVVELGSGRGRNCFWLNSFIGCSAVGVEYVPEFIERSNRIKSRLGIKGVEFVEGDFIKGKINFDNPTVYYLYGSCLSDAEIETLAEKLSKSPKGTKIITVSYSLSEYHEGFEVLKHFTAPFTWGTADVYIQAVV